MRRHDSDNNGDGDGLTTTREAIIMLNHSAAISLGNGSYEIIDTAFYLFIATKILTN